MDMRINKEKRELIENEIMDRLQKSPVKLKEIPTKFDPDTVMRTAKEMESKGKIHVIQYRSKGYIFLLPIKAHYISHMLDMAKYEFRMNAYKYRGRKLNVNQLPRVTEWIVENKLMENAKIIDKSKAQKFLENYDMGQLLEEAMNNLYPDRIVIRDKNSFAGIALFGR